MSKFILRKRLSGHTTVSNNVIKALKHDLTSLGLYLYLLSLPDDWEFYKTELCKSFKMGIKKLEAKFKILRSYGLIMYGQERNEKGQFEKFNLEIFDTEQPNVTENEQKHPVGQNCRTVKTVRRFREATNKEITNKELNKTNISSSSVDEGERNDVISSSMKSMGVENESDKVETTLFDSFWEAYPKKRDKQSAKKAWDRNKCDSIYSTIMADIETRKTKDNQWREIQYIPYASTYLNGKRWEDDMTPMVKTVPKVQQPTFPRTQDNVRQPSYRDFTQERIDREMIERSRSDERKENRSHGESGNRGRGQGMRSLEDYLLP